MTGRRTAAVALATAVVVVAAAVAVWMLLPEVCRPGYSDGGPLRDGEPLEGCFGPIDDTAPRAKENRWLAAAPLVVGLALVALLLGRRRRRC